MTTDIQSLLYRPLIFQSFPEMAAAQSLRHGGVSPAPWHTLNLGKSTGDHPDNLAENRRRFCNALGFEPPQMAWSTQVHGTEIRVVTEPGGSEGFDALISDRPGILLCVSVADCTPILVYDPKRRVAAAIHAGWRGTAQGIVVKTLEKMAELYGVSGADCRVFIGACIDECSFEVGEEVAVSFADAFKRFDSEKKKFFVDLKAANAAQCRAFGIPATQVEVSPFCTVRHNADYFSHRKEKGLTGRMLGAIGAF